MKRKLQLLLGIAVLMFGIAGPAHAAVSLNIALTATVQESITAVSPTATQYKTQRIRITQKDILTRLGEIYSIPDGAQLILSTDFSFLIVDQNINVLQVVNPSYLNFAIGGEWVSSGIYESDPNRPINLKQLTAGTMAMNINSANSFTLAGIIDFGLIDPRTRPEIYSGKVTLLGLGKTDNKTCVISGKMNFKINIEI